MEPANLLNADVDLRQHLLQSTVGQRRHGLVTPTHFLSVDKHLRHGPASVGPIERVPTGPTVAHGVEFHVRAGDTEVFEGASDTRAEWTGKGTTNGEKGVGGDGNEDQHKDPDGDRDKRQPQYQHHYHHQHQGQGRKGGHRGESINRGPTYQVVVMKATTGLLAIALLNMTLYSSFEARVVIMRALRGGKSVQVVDEE